MSPVFRTRDDSPRHMQPNTLAKIQGPGPLSALIHRQATVPTKRKAAIMMVCPASTYVPVKIAACEAVERSTDVIRASEASLIPRQLHLQAKSRAWIIVSPMSTLNRKLDVRPTKRSEKKDEHLTLEDHNKWFRWRGKECSNDNQEAGLIKHVSILAITK
jgi:hypothetical protein